MYVVRNWAIRIFESSVTFQRFLSWSQAIFITASINLRIIPENLNPRFQDRRVRYRIFMYSSPLLAWGNNLVCVQLLNDLLQEMPHRLIVRYSTRSENLQEEEFEKAVSSRCGEDQQNSKYIFFVGLHHRKPRWKPQNWLFVDVSPFWRGYFQVPC